MNFSEVGEVLHITRDGARKRILKYQDAEELQEFLIRDPEGKIVGLKDDGIEVLRNLGASRRSFSEERNISTLKHRIELLEAENGSLKEISDNHKQYIAHLEGEIYDLKDQIQRQKAELDAFKGMSLWQRLTYKG